MLKKENILIKIVSLIVNNFGAIVSNIVILLLIVIIIVDNTPRDEMPNRTICHENDYGVTICEEVYDSSYDSNDNNPYDRIKGW